MTTSPRKRKKKKEGRGWGTNDTTVRNLNEISTWNSSHFLYVCVCWNVVTALHLTRHCGKHQLIRFTLSSRVVLKNVFSEKSGDNVMKKVNIFHLPFCAFTHPSSYARSYFCMRQFYLRSAIQMYHRRKKNFRRHHYRVLYMHGSVEGFSHTTSFLFRLSLLLLLSLFTT